MPTKNRTVEAPHLERSAILYRELPLLLVPIRGDRSAKKIRRPSHRQSRLRQRIQHI